MIGMLTAPKLVAGLLFAVIAYAATVLVIPLLPEGFDPGRIAQVNPAIGFAVGWVVAGARAGTGWNASMSYGLTAAVALVFWVLLLDCIALMLRLSLRGQYDGAMEAVTDVFQKMLEFGILLRDPSILVVLIGGSVVAGLLTEVSSRMWR